MADRTDVDTRTRTKVKVERPRLHKVPLLNDDYTPHDFVVLVLKSVFWVAEKQAYKIMMTAHQRSVCVVSVYPREVAETKADEATRLAQEFGHPLTFTREPEE